MPTEAIRTQKKPTHLEKQLIIIPLGDVSDSQVTGELARAEPKPPGKDTNQPDPTLLRAVGGHWTTVHCIKTAD